MAAEAERKRPLRRITKPRPVSPAMQALVGVPEIPRTQALKLIWAYIKQHDLQLWQLKRGQRLVEKDERINNRGNRRKKKICNVLSCICASCIPVLNDLTWMMPIVPGLQ